MQDRLLRLLDVHRVLTTEQVGRITGAPQRTTEYRLARLAEQRLVGRVRPPRGRGTHPWHWWLTPAGARQVRGTACAEDRGGPNPLFVRHAAATAEVWLALREHGPAAGLHLVRWWRDVEGWAQWHPPGQGLAGRLRRVTPDATAHLTIDGLPTGADGAPALGAVMVEVDLATMTATRLRDKLYRYRDYAADRAWAGVHPHPPVLLVLTTTPARAVTFLRGAAKLVPARSRWAASDDLDTAGAEADRLIVAACGWVREPAVAVGERVWMLPGDTAEITLADLLTDRVAAARHAAALTAEAQRAWAAHRWADTVAALAGDHAAVAALAAWPAAAQVLRMLQASGEQTLADWLAAHGEAGQALVAWWHPRARSPYSRTGPPPPDATAALAGDYPLRWQAQANRLLTATAAITAAAPGWQGAAAQALAGVLLTAGELQAAVDARETPEQTQQRILARPLPPAEVGGGYPPWQPEDYPTRRERAVAAGWARLGRLERWRTSPAELAAGYDTEHLTRCPVCSLAVPTPVADERCPGCNTGWGHEHAAGGDVPCLQTQLAAVLTGAAPLPEPAAPW